MRWCCMSMRRDTAICMPPNTATTSRILSSKLGGTKFCNTFHTNHSLPPTQAQPATVTCLHKVLQHIPNQPLTTTNAGITSHSYLSAPKKEQTTSSTETVSLEVQVLLCWHYRRATGFNFFNNSCRVVSLSSILSRPAKWHDASTSPVGTISNNSKTGILDMTSEKQNRKFTHDKWETKQEVYT